MFIFLHCRHELYTILQCTEPDRLHLVSSEKNHLIPLTCWQWKLLFCALNLKTVHTCRKERCFPLDIMLLITGKTRIKVDKIVGRILWSQRYLWICSCSLYSFSYKLWYFGAYLFNFKRVLFFVSLIMFISPLIS